MKVIDINGKEREVKYIKKIYNSITDAVSGETVQEVFIEVLILGHNHDWVEWWPLAEFRKFNPRLKPRFKRE